MQTYNDVFYDQMASSYHLLFEDWQETIDRQSAIIASLLETPAAVGPILDCACGIGTQALGLASDGFFVEGTDRSSSEVNRAKAEAKIRNLQIDFRVDDMLTLETAKAGKFGVVLAFDNALPHLDTEEDVLTALAAMRDRLRSGGKLLISLRDYGPLMLERPTMMPPRFLGNEGNRRIVVHQIWDWEDERHYLVHIFITTQSPDQRWATNHFTGRYRAITPQEVAELMHKVGLGQVEVMHSHVTKYYQPIVSGIRP